MNIISNTCLGAYITRDFLKEPYQNPFQWNIIDFNSMKNLIENYDKLKSLKYSIKILKNNDYPTMIFENNIIIDFVHIKLKSKKYKTINNQNNVFVDDKDIIEYTMTKYKNRLDRQKEPPLFVIHNQPHHPITGNKFDLLNLYNNINSKYPIIIVTNNHNLFSKDNILVTHLPNRFLDMPQKTSVILGPIIAKYSNFF